MATTDAPNVEETTSEGWTTVAAESGTPLLFDVGTVFVGTYLGIRHIVPPTSTKPEDEFDQAQFTDAEGNTKTINLGYKLFEALQGVTPNSTVRITRMADVPSNDPKKNDMKDYRVEVKS